MFRLEQKHLSIVIKSVTHLSGLLHIIMHKIKNNILDFFLNVWSWFKKFWPVLLVIGAIVAVLSML